MDAPPQQPLRVTPELEVLVGLFYPSMAKLGEFHEVSAAELPPVPRKLLWHDEHMTVALESHYGCPLAVCVLRSLLTDTHYARHVLLSCGYPGKMVQYGIVRLNLTFLDAEVRREIESERIPLGRALIKYDVLRKVRLLSLWKIVPADVLQALFRLDGKETCYGRTALIYCNEVPAVELLEIVTLV